MSTKYLSQFGKLSILTGILALTALSTMAQYISFDTSFVELDTSKIVHTSDSNYGISSQESSFPPNWRAVSVNGDEVTIATKDGQQIIKTYVQLSQLERTNLESLKSSLTQLIRMGPFNVRSRTGLAKITTFDRNGGSSSMGAGGGSSSSSSSSSSSGGGTSIQRTGSNAFIVSKQDFPFNWHRVFVNEDLVTVVYKSSRVIMLPQNLLKPEERTKVEEIRNEVQQSSKAAEDLTRQFASGGAFSSPMDFVSKAMSGMFGR